ncbi:hypothetical protein [Paenibacillus sp. sgz500958]|uniref:hypothetical protein n=1 Tax=Paenibacillus sp. sgz500958 TaxID=3242475 RepID=UPI0036D20C2E
MRKFLMLIFIFVVILSLAGCTSKENGLKQATKEIENSGGVIPNVKGFEVKEIDILSDPLVQDRESFIYLFTDKKGELNKAKNNSSDIRILYGPYKGTDIFKITQSKMDIITDNINEKVINGMEMQYKTVNNRVIIFTKTNGNSYTYEAKITERYSEDKHFDLFYEAITNR